MAAYLFQGCVIPSTTPHTQWHTGEPIPESIKEARVVTVQADGDELDIIMRAMNKTSQWADD